MNTVSFIWKKIRPHVLVCLFFLVIALVYFAPKFQGMQVRQGDIEKYVEMSQEVREYYQKEGIGSSWTGSMFSGMPTYTVSTQGGPVNFLNYLEIPVKAIGTGDAGVVFFSLVGFYVLMLILGANIPVAMLGALAFSFSSYSIIILQAGHVTKAWVMAYMPLVVSGFVLVLRQKFLTGGLIFAATLALQIKNYHIQISYYLALFCCLIYLGYVVVHIRNKNWKPVYLSLLTLVIAVVVAVMCNLGTLYSNLELSKESIRGKSELSHHVDGKTDKSSGLDKDYAFAWSYGVGETFTMLIPNFYGGESGGLLDKSSNLGRVLQGQGQQVPDKFQSYTYWGDKPFTSGPVYLGAIICMLFVFSLFIIKHPLKWWLAGASLFFIFMSWGRHFDGFNTFLFHYLPLYNKFRTVEMALVIPQFAFCLLAGWGLIELYRGQNDKKYLLKSLYYAVGITGGLCLFFALFAPLSFHSLYDAQYQMPDWYMNALVADRESLLRADAFRSLIFILLGGGCVYFFIRSAKPSRYLFYVLAGLVLIDLWGVDKRYLNESHFVKPNVTKQLHAPTAADRAILQDRDVSYRVLTLAEPFNNSSVSYYHKSIGGYNAAKLRRYQDLIELKLEPEIALIKEKLAKVTTLADAGKVFEATPVLNMLNMRYLILNPSYAPVRNPYAYGNAWFVPTVEIVENADEEMSELQKAEPRQIALVDKRFQSLISKRQWNIDSTAEIKLVTYKPDRLEYKYRSSEPGVIVFSEVFYPHGWKAAIDGREAPHFRTNWILRGMEVPAGEHTISFRFEPDGYLAGRWVATVCSALLVLALLFFLFRYIRNEVKTLKDESGV